MARFLGLGRHNRFERVGFVLYGAAVAAARDPWLYKSLGVPDTLDGRFDLVGLHVVLVIDRLTREADPGPALAQAVFDAMFSDMDMNLREMGVSDLSVGRRVRAMWEALHGRASAYAGGAGSPGIPPRCTAALARNVWRGSPPGEAGGGRARAPDPRPGGASGRAGAGRIARRPGALPAGAGSGAVTPELHRPVAADRVGAKGLEITVQASDAECAAP